jgi:hypothetical protein
MIKRYKHYGNGYAYGNNNNLSLFFHLLAVADFYYSNADEGHGQRSYYYKRAHESQYVAKYTEHDNG